jgi:hypothetical protein
MRPSEHDNNITRKVADRLISHLAARRGLRWPPAGPSSDRRQPDLFNAEVIKNIDPDMIEDLGRGIIEWRLHDMARGLRYVHSMELHQVVVDAFSSKILDLLAGILGAPYAANEIRSRGLALARLALKKGIVRGGE